jgi:triacylglycerol lipase
VSRSGLCVAFAAVAWLAVAGAAPVPVPPAAVAGVAGSHAPPSPSRTDVPVLLVPGWFDTARELAALRIRLLGAGWSHVETLTFRDPTGSNREHAEEIDSLVAAVLAETGADELDIVAHSMGGLATRWYLKTRAGAPVRRAVFIASPHRGTLTAHLAWGEGREEMMPESEFLAALNSGPALPPGIEAITIRTPIDTRVVPGESATLRGVEDHTVCCPTHQGLLRNDEVFLLVVDFLERMGTTVARH